MTRSGTKVVLAALVLSMAIGLPACGGGDDDGGSIDAPSADASAADGAGAATVPAAPTGLAAELLEGGAHLTWVDNSDDETQFMIMRKVEGDPDYVVVASPPFDTTQYHDAPLTAGTTYMYMVMAMNDAGESDPSNEVTIAIP